MAEFKRTNVAPPGLVAKPKLGSFLTPYLSAYLALDRRRGLGYSSPQPLTPSDIIAYGLSNSFGPDLEFFLRAMSELDDEYMTEVNKKLSASSKKGRKGKGK